MFRFIECYWRELREAPAGERFQRLYRLRRSVRMSMATRAAFLVGGFALMTVGLILMFVPGPGTLVFFAGGALVAQESLWTARAMDWLELWARWLIAAALHRWQRLKKPRTIHDRGR